MRVLLVLSLASLLLAGCGSKDSPTNEVAQGVETGGLKGNIVDEAIVPIEGVIVTVNNRTDTTDANGAWAIDGLVPGTYFVRAQGQGFSTVEVAATVVAGEMTTVALPLQRLASEAPYIVPETWEGFIECSIRIGSAGAGGSVGLNACNDIGRQDVNRPHEFPDGTPDWFQIELSWESTQVAGSDLSLIIGPPDCTDLDYHRRDGPSPLWYGMDSFELGARGIGEDTGLCSRVFAWTSSELQHVAGVQLQQGFTSFIHTFYNAQPGPGWLFVDNGAP